MESGLGSRIKVAASLGVVITSSSWVTGGEVGVIVGGTDVGRRVDVELTLDIGAVVDVAVGKLDGGAVGVTDGVGGVGVGVRVGDRVGVGWVQATVVTRARARSQRKRCCMGRVYPICLAQWPFR